MFERDEERGQVGIGTLIVFIAMVLVAAIAAGVLINTAGFLQSKSEQTGEQSSQQVTNRLDAVTVTGNVDGETVDELNMTVKKAPGADDINLENVTLQYVGPDGTTTLTIGDDDLTRPVDGTANAVFNTSAVKDADDSVPVMNSPDDRVELGVELEQPGDTDSALDAFEEGETATLTLTTQSGGSTEVRVEVPPSLSGENAVEL
jgi:flagellin-like protein